MPTIPPRRIPHFAFVWESETACLMFVQLLCVLPCNALVGHGQRVFLAVDVVVHSAPHPVKVEARALLCPKPEQVRESDVIPAPDPPIAVLQSP